jgi:hypothetical protein
LGNKYLEEDVQKTIKDFVKFYYDNGHTCKRKAFEAYKVMDSSFYHEYGQDIMRALDLAKGENKMVDLEQYETLSNYIEEEIIPKLDDDGMKAHEVRVLYEAIRDLQKQLEHNEGAAEATGSGMPVTKMPDIMNIMDKHFNSATDELESAIIGKMRLFVKRDYATKEIVCVHTTKEGECSKCKARYRPIGEFFSIVNDNPYHE